MEILLTPRRPGAAAPARLSRRSRGARATPAARASAEPGSRRSPAPPPRRRRNTADPGPGGPRRRVFRTSGQRLEPPMPSTSAWVKPAARTSSASPRSSFTRASWSPATSSQPSQLDSSAPVHKVASRAQSRRTLSPEAHSSRVARTAAARSAGSWKVVVSSITVTGAGPARERSGRRPRGRCRRYPGRGRCR